jgi:hypothetical protein
MFNELVIHHVKKNTSRFMFLNQNHYRVGKALDNDLVLLDADCPSYLGSIEKQDGQYVWQEQESTFHLHNPYVSHGFRFHIQSQKKWLSVGVFLGLFLISLIFFQWMYHGDMSMGTASHTLPARGTYGSLNASNEANRVASVEFEFSIPKGKYLMLHFTSGNLSKSNDLLININGHFLGYAPASPGKWNIETQKFIPTSVLNEKNNKVSFHFQGSKSLSWGVRDIYIQSFQEMPVQQDGKDFLIMAKKLLRERSVKAGNLVRAQQVLDQASQFYQAKNEETPELISKLISQTQKEKYRLILDHAELIRKHKREGEKQKARNVYARLMDELIDPVDPDRLAVQKEFE